MLIGAASYFGVLAAVCGACELINYLKRGEPDVVAVFDHYAREYQTNSFGFTWQKLKDINDALESLPEERRTGVILYLLYKLPIKKSYPEALKELFLLHILATEKKVNAATTINDAIFGTLTKEQAHNGKQAILHLVESWNANIPPDMPDERVRMADLFALIAQKNRTALNGEYQAVKAAWDKLPPWD